MRFTVIVDYNTIVRVKSFFHLFAPFTDKRAHQNVAEVLQIEHDLYTPNGAIA